MPAGHAPIQGVQALPLLLNEPYGHASQIVSASCVHWTAANVPGGHPTVQFVQRGAFSISENEVSLSHALQDRSEVAVASCISKDPGLHTCSSAQNASRVGVPIRSVYSSGLHTRCF